MTTSEELRAWAVYDRHADMNNLPYAAWNAMADWRRREWTSWFEDHFHARTFALLVACALEDEA